MYVDWPTKVIYIAKSDLTLIQSSPIEIRELNLDTFRLGLKDLEDSDEGMHFPTTHNHNPPVSVGGVTLARVVEIINDYTITFENGAYAVNLVGANSNVADRLNLNQVSVRAANSAGLVQSREIEYASFQNAVWYDVLNGASGTIYPIGTPSKPVNNFDDAMLIAELRGFKKIDILGSATINAGTFSEMIFTAPETVGHMLTIASGASVNQCRFEEMNITGTFNGTEVHISRCVLMSATCKGGFIEETILSGTITLQGSGSTFLIRCGDANPTSTAPIFDLTSYSGPLTFAEFTGDLRFQNKTNAAPVSININGNVTLDASVTAGHFIITGMGKLTNNATGTATVDTSAFLSTDNLATAASLTAIQSLIETLLKYETNRTRVDATAKTLTIYDDDNTTPIKVFDLKDFAGVASVTEIAERTPV